MSLSFDPISSPGATRDLFIDLSGALETDELLTLAAVTSACPTVLSVSNVAINDKVVEMEGLETSIGQGIHFTIKTLLESQATVSLYVDFAGNNNTEDKYEISQPIIGSLCH